MSHSSLPIAELSDSELRLALAEARMEITVLRAQLIQLRARLKASEAPRLTLSDIVETDPEARRTSAPPPLMPKQKLFSSGDL